MAPMLSCAVCLYLTGEHKKAFTIANSQAVCEPHFNQIKRHVSNSGGTLALSQLVKLMANP